MFELKTAGLFVATAVGRDRRLRSAVPVAAPRRAAGSLLPAAAAPALFASGLRHAVS